MKKYILLLLLATIISTAFFTNYTLDAKQNLNPDDSTYTIINEDGTTKTITYNEEDAYAVSLTSLDEELINISDIQYGVARIKGYTTYKEYDDTTSKKARTGYTHGTSANDAAFIKVLNDGNTIRVKQAGVYMDIPAGNVEVSEYNDSSYVSYYIAKDGKLYHCYYYGEYGTKPKLSSTMVGYTPEYLKENTKYYSYDGHYFYKNYKTMIDDYKKGTQVFTNSVNKNNPYYNYYQYLSLRTPSEFNEKDINNFILNRINNYSSTTQKSKLYNSGDLFIDNQDTYGVNASLMLGIAINESNWGMSSLSLNRNNLFGLNATDHNVNNAYYFDSVSDCVEYFTSVIINAGYLDGSDTRYFGSHLGDKQSGINVCYSSDPYWGEKAAYYNYMLNELNENKDYLKYKIVIGNNGNIMFNKENNLNSVIYSSGASVSTNTNYFVYNVPFTVIEEGSTYYKIYSDTILNEKRTGLYPYKTATFDLTRDYVYISKKDVTVIYEGEDNTLLGDVNKDDKVSALDYILIKNHILKTRTLADEELQRADINKDNKISAVDYILIKNHILGTSKLF